MADIEAAPGLKSCLRGEEVVVPGADLGGVRGGGRGLTLEVVLVGGEGGGETPPDPWGLHADRGLE